VNSSSRTEDILQADVHPIKPRLKVLLVVITMPVILIIMIIILVIVVVSQGNH